jgi:hypothetical protein
MCFLTKNEHFVNNFTVKKQVKNIDTADLERL